MKVKKKLLVYFNRETTVDEFVEIFDGVLGPGEFKSTYETMRDFSKLWDKNEWPDDREISVFPKKNIEIIGKQFVRKSSDTVAILVMKNGNLKWVSFCYLDFYQKSKLYDGWHVIPVDDFIMKYRPELKQKFYFEDELMNLLCPLGGDETNDCADCPYAGDYHFVDGECVRRDD